MLLPESASGSEQVFVSVRLPVFGRETFLTGNPGTRGFSKLFVKRR